MERLAPSALNLLAATVCIVLAIIVYQRNPVKSSHRSFVILGVNLGLWALSVFWVVQCWTLAQARVAVSTCEIIACFMPANFYRFVAHFPTGKFEGSPALSRVLYIGAAVLALLTPNAAYIQRIEVFASAPPTVTFGPLYAGYFLLLLIALFSVSASLTRKFRAATGLERRQIQYVFFGVVCMGALGIFTVSLSQFLRIPVAQAYGPVGIIVMMSFIAVAMIRYHLLDTRTLLARTIVLSAMITFVLISVTAITFGLNMLFQGDVRFAEYVPAIIAAVFVVVGFQTIRGRIEEFVEGTLLHNRYDVNQLYTRVAGQAAEELSLERLLETVAEDIAESIGVAHVRVMLVDPEDTSSLSTAFSTVDEEPRPQIESLDQLLRYLRETKRPIVLERLLQRHPTSEERRVAESLASLDAHLCVPLYTSSGLVGLLLLGQKRSHDIYTSAEFTAFYALAGPLGTAIANARLYEEVDSLNLHLSNLFRQMREGIVATDMRGFVTTCNEAALKLLGTVHIGQPIDTLPDEVAKLLRFTLDREQGMHDFETEIRTESVEPVPVIMSSSCLQAHDGSVTGAVALIYDVLQVKRLEQHVQRADRLSSVGTLAAGMAHEIKNPLVSIKTFSQLLTSRFEDEDFRKTFNEVVPVEVDRIDTIVSRLLDFARPRPVSFSGQNVRETIQGVLALIENEARKGSVTIETDFPDHDLMVHGDEHQLHQVFLNLVLNALEAVRPGTDGSLRISVTTTHRYLRRGAIPGPEDTTCAQITVSDSGCGIPEDQIDQLFTPFFTTKANGCGLGLAVVHGIVSEHGGEIHVASRENEGTTLTIILPLSDSVGSQAATVSADTQ